MDHAIKVMSFNVRTGDAPDGRHAWSRRNDVVTGTIRGYDPDLLGLQETTRAQWAELLAALGDRWEGVFGDREDPKVPGSHGQGLFFRRDRFRLAGQERFWLSDTPDAPGSITFPNDWGARIAVVARLDDLAAGRPLYFADAHFDTHPGAWLPSARLLSARLPATAPAIAVGDFNCPGGSEAWRFLVGEGGWRDAWTETGRSDEGAVTFHGFTGLARLPLDRPDHLDDWLKVVAPRDAPHVRAARNFRIDWILARGALAAREAAIDARTFDGRVSSDHFPVTATLAWAG